MPEYGVIAEDLAADLVARHTSYYGIVALRADLVALVKESLRQGYADAARECRQMEVERLARLIPPSEETLTVRYNAGFVDGFNAKSDRK